MLRDRIKSTIQSAIEAAQAAGALPSFDLPTIEISRPKQVEHGDYTCNVALVASAAIRKSGGNANPRAIAEAIVKHLPASDFLGKVELAGPGFINLRLSDSWLQKQVGEIVLAGQQYGNSERGKGQRWQVEYVSANPTGPIHYGGARNAVLGESVARVLEAAGYTIQREFYVNDFGTQFALFAETLYARYCQHYGRDVAIPEEGYQGEYVIDYAAQVAQAHGDRFLNLSREEAIVQLRPIARELVVTALEQELKRIGVVFNRWFSEQSLHEEGLVEQSLDYLQQRGELEKRDGAVWFLASKYPGIEKDVVVIRSNGKPTYFTSDIAYHYDKFVRRGFDHVVNVWSVDHQGHVARMGAIMQSLGLDPSRLTILLYDLVKLVRDGKEVKLSKRKGNLVTINDVVDEVGSDAIHFMLLNRSPESVVEFDLDLAVEKDNENPVYYVQYGHARICSILVKAAEEGLALTESGAVDFHLLVHPSEFALIRKLLELEEQIDIAVDKLSPHNLTYYAIELARIFSGFYRDCKVVDSEQPALSRARLCLAQATRTVLAKTLTLLGVSAPESM
ncbi:MAG: arginine--tRNA ligase [Caldilineaceae bacterium]